MIDRPSAPKADLPLLAGAYSVPEPDVAVVPWSDDGWQFEHPDRCLLAVEISDTTLMQDRLSKSRIYAAAGVEHFWIVNLRSREVEWFSDPVVGSRLYGNRGVAVGDDLLPATSLDLAPSAAGLFPPRTATP